MSKLLKLRQWLTLDEAIVHLSSVLGEAVTEADLYRLSLDGYLVLSVNLVNHAQGRMGKLVTTDEVTFVPFDNSFLPGFIREQSDNSNIAVPSKGEIRVSDNLWACLESDVVPISGVWDLSMLGAEKLDIEHYYQQLTSGLEVTLTALDGVFVKSGEIICQLQESFDDNEFVEGSRAVGKALEERIKTHNISDEEAEILRSDYKEQRAKYIERFGFSSANCYPAGGLASVDSVLVVKVDELTRFIQSLSDSEDSQPSEVPLGTTERNSLLKLIGAMCKELKIDHNKRGVATALEAMTEINGAPLTDDTIRKILKQIDSAVSSRVK